MKDVFQKNNPEFISLFKERHVAIVAGGAEIEDQGEEIDARDVVVRLNNAHLEFPYSDEIARKYGKKCDIIFRDPSDFVYGRHAFCDGSSVFDYSLQLQNMGVRNLIFSTALQNPQIFVELFNSVFYDKFRTLKLSSQIFDWLNKKLNSPGRHVTTGLIAVTAIALSDPKSIMLFGFNFYVNSGHDSVYNVKVPPCPKLNNRYHDFKKEFQIFKTTVRHLYPMQLSLSLKKLVASL